MTKAVRELSVIFDKDEVSEIWEIFLADCVARAIHHFVKNEGMSIEEALKRVLINGISLELILSSSIIRIKTFLSSSLSK